MGKKSKLITYDFETGGLDPEVNPVMEIALVVTDQYIFEEETHYTTLVKPYAGKNGESLIYDPRALDTHGIPVADCSALGIPVNDLVKNLIRIFKEFTPKGDKGTNRPILCGHNVAFDNGFLRYVFALCGEELTNYVYQSNKEIISWDTMQMFCQAHNIKPDLDFSLSLGECLKAYGLGSFLAHRALPDVRATNKLLKTIVMGDMRSNKDAKEKGNKTVNEVEHRSVDLLSRPAKFEM